MIRYFLVLAFLGGSLLIADMVLGFMAASSLLIIVKHHPNIRLLLARTENKFRQGHK